MVCDVLTEPLSTMSRSYLPTLPTELLLLICGSLPVTPRIALALTCKSFFFTLGIVEKPVRDQETELLLLLEKDTPSHYLCFGCKKLRRFVANPRLGWPNKGHRRCGAYIKKKFFFGHDGYCWEEVGENQSLRDFVYTDEACVKFNLHTWKPHPRGPQISFSEAHLIMSRHLYGQNYGLSLHTLQQEFNFESFIRLGFYDHFPLERHPPGKRYGLRPMKNGDNNGFSRHKLRTRPTGASGVYHENDIWSFNHKYDAKVVDDELYVARFHRVHGVPMPTDFFAAVFRGLEIPICSHAFEEDRWYYESSRCQMDNLVEIILRERDYIDTKDYKVQFEPASKYFDGSCDHCFTDYEFLVQKDETGWTLEFTTYHRLGRCQTPDDPIWQCLVSPSKHFGIGREEADQSFVAGWTRKKWYEIVADTINV